MSSNHGADTAKVMDDMRRQTKRKQAKKTVVAGAAELEDVPLPKVLIAKFAGETAESMRTFFKDHPEILITTDDLRRKIANGTTIFVEGQDVNYPNLAGTIIEISDKGIKSPVSLHRIEVLTGGGFAIAFHFQYGRIHVS
jgi:hypothetical protein